MLELRKLFAGVMAYGVIALILGLTPAHADKDDRQLFNIEAQSLAPALSEFARQSKQALLFSPEIVAEKTTGGVQGTLPPLEALSAILRNTGIRFSTTPSGAILLRSDVTAFAHGLEEIRLAQTDVSAKPEGADNRTDGPRDVEKGIEEVVVTAQKREERLMQVPVSLTAVTAENIEIIGAKNLEDLAKSVPGVVIRSGSEQVDKTFVIRGISSYAQSATVAVYIDDTPITFGSYTPDLKVFDVAQIEFLRGPQGTLFGSSSMGGAIRYASIAPSFDSTGGMVKLEGGAVRDGGQDYEIQGAVGGPIASNTLAFRASVFSRHDAGYIDLRDEDTGAIVNDDANTVDSYGGRFALKAVLRESIDATLSAIYQRQNADQSANYFSARGMQVSTPMSDSRVDRTDVYRNDTTFLPNLTVNADLGIARLTSSTSYINRDIDTGVDFSYYIQRALGLPNTTARGLTVASLEGRQFEGWAQEVRLVSQSSGPVDWIAGAYYSTNEQRDERTLPTNLGIVAPAFGSGPLFDESNLWTRKQKALFGELSYTLAEKLRLAAGVRFTDASLRVRLNTNGLFNGGLTVSDNTSSEKPVTPRLSVQYAFSPQAMGYMTAAKGFREGGSNNPIATGIPACAAALAAIGLTDAPISYDTDSVWSYELGTKVQTADRGLRFIGSVYRIDWSGIQQRIGLAGGCGGAFIGNLGEARSQGFEAESAWQVTGNLTFNLAIGYTDAHLIKDLILGSSPVSGPIVAAPSGRKLPNVPERTMMLAGQYDFNPFGAWSAYGRAELQYIGKSKQSLGTPSDDPRALNTPSFTLTNLRLGAVNGSYEMSLFVNNLFDDDTAFFKSYAGFAPGPGFDQYDGQRNRPRTVGMSVKRQF